MRCVLRPGASTDAPGLGRNGVGRFAGTLLEAFDAPPSQQGAPSLPRWKARRGCPVESQVSALMGRWLGMEKEPLHWSAPIVNVGLAIAAGIVGMVVTGFTGANEPTPGSLIASGIMAGLAWLFTVGIFINYANENHRERLAKERNKRANGGIYVNQHGMKISD